MSITLIKLGYLFIKSIAKPVSNVVKKQAVNNKTFRQGCLNLAQRYHQWEVKLRRRLQGGIAIEHVKPLEESKAIELGANFIGETIVFGMVGTAILLETTRLKSLERARKEELEERVNQLE